MASWATKSIRIDTATPTTNSRQSTKSARIAGHSKRFPMRATLSLRSRPLPPAFRARRDTGRAMSKESSTPDLVELVRRLVEAVTRFDFDAAMSLFALDAVVEGRASGMTFE